MPNYLFVYHGGKKPKTPEEGQAAMVKWNTWFGNIANHIVDGGNPVGISKAISTKGTAETGSSNPISGYSVISADNIDGACKLSQGCPVVEGGGSVEIAEITPI